MVSGKIAKRYAHGLLEFAKEQNLVEQLYGEMKDLAGTVKNSTELKKFLNAPFIDSKKKMSVAGSIFQGLSNPAKNFIQMIIKHGRESQLVAIAEKFTDTVDSENGVQKVTVTVSTEVSPQTLHSILSTSKMVNDKPNVQLIIDPNIIGGYIIRVGDQQIDASVRTKLDRMRKQFQN